MSDGTLKADLTALSTTLTRLHKALMDHQFKKYEKDQGRIQHNGEKLQLLLSHTDFQWLRPLSHAIADLDDQVESDSMDGAEIKGTLKEIELLLFSDRHKTFSEQYQPFEPGTPEIILLHQELKNSLQSISKKNPDA